MRRRASAHRRDDNHQAVVAALRAAGWYVLDTSQVGGGCPDLFVAKGGRLVPIELKDGAKVPSARLLTMAEIKVCDAFDRAGVRVRVVSSIEEALAL